MNDTWDIAIVGAGTAGAPAAIMAARRGARVVLIEASDRIGGTMALTSGSYSTGGSSIATAQGIEDTPERHFADCMRISKGTSEEAILRLWTDHAPAAFEWLIEEGLTFAPEQPVMSSAHEFYDERRVYSPIGGGDSYIAAFQRALQEQIDTGRVTLLLGTKMTSIETGADGSAVAVMVESADGEQRIAASDIVLTTGGYCHNDDLWRELHGDAPRRVYASPFARGEGHRAAKAAGGQFAYAERYLPTYGATEDIDNPGRFWIHTRISPGSRPPWEVVVNANGERFMAEDNRSNDYRELRLRDQPGHSFWVLYDEAIRAAAPKFFFWDEAKLARAFAESPHFQKADTIAELADACGIDPATLEKTIARYNEGQAAQSDEFGRQHLPAPLATGPFYAVRHSGTACVTWGGIKVDGALRVLNADGAPIPHLYAAGEILGMGVFGDSSPAGCTVSSSVTFGCVLGRRLGADVAMAKAA